MNKCQVCGTPIGDGVLNCITHSYVRSNMTKLAQDIWNLKESIDVNMVKLLAAKHGCHECTVRNHLKRQGYQVKRGWKQGD